MESKEQIILGDLNCNYLSDRNNMHLSQLKQLSSTYQFQQLINEPTRITPNFSTLIDSGAPARAKRAWDRAPYSWNMVNLFSFGCHVIDRAYVRTRLQIVRVG